MLIDKKKEGGRREKGYEDLLSKTLVYKSLLGGNI